MTTQARHDIAREYVRIRAQGVPASAALSRARAAVAYNAGNAEIGGRWASLGGYTRAVDEQGREYPSLWDTGNRESASTAFVRLTVAADSFSDSVLDFDCCPDPATGKPDTGARWTICQCARRRAEDGRIDWPTTAYGNGRACEYGQPCGHKCDEARRTNAEGVYGIYSEIRNRVTGLWSRVDDSAVWGFVGNDWHESGYDMDAMSAAIEAFEHQDGC
ncbi:MAG: hypothetical protein M0Q49_05620 [Porticoccaceae bacterium]|nr:hypothetical protein [Porticoccaceae bacterium]